METAKPRNWKVPSGSGAIGAEHRHEATKPQEAKVPAETAPNVRSKSFQPNHRTERCSKHQRNDANKQNRRKEQPNRRQKGTKRKTATRAPLRQEQANSSTKGYQTETAQPGEQTIKLQHKKGAKMEKGAKRAEERPGRQTTELKGVRNSCQRALQRQAETVLKERKREKNEKNQTN